VPPESLLLRYDVIILRTNNCLVFFQDENPLDQNLSPLPNAKPIATSVPNNQQKKEENKLQIKQEVDESANNTSEPADNANENFITSDWHNGSLWPLRTRDDPTCPGGADEAVSLSEMLNIDEFFDNTNNGTESNLETGQDDDPIRSPLTCDYNYSSSEIPEGKTFYDMNEDGAVSDGLDDLMAYFDETEFNIKYDISTPVQNMEEPNTECTELPAFMQKVCYSWQFRICCPTGLRMTKLWMKYNRNRKA
jgi:hypothetical protein